MVERVVRPGPDTVAAAVAAVGRALYGHHAEPWDSEHLVVSALLDLGWRPLRDADGRHWYLSTSCLHAADEHRDETERAFLHGRCQTDAKRFDGSRKVAATCKYGQEPCRCECHTTTTTMREERPA
jgi:hypothetical protein